MAIDTSALQRAKQHYTDAVLVGDGDAARRSIDDAIRVGLGPWTIYIDILEAAQAVVGEERSAQRVSVADEHAATQITVGEMNRLRGMMKPRAPLGREAVVTAVVDEGHMLGARIVADFLSMDGWRVHYLGENVPSEDLARFADGKSAALVALSVAREEYLPAMGDVIGAVRTLAKPPKVLATGPAAANPETAYDLGVDAVAKDAPHAVRVARALVGISDSNESLDQFLRDLGGRIQLARTSRHWTQQQLAHEAGMDRAYVGALERGKQNPTIAAIMKIACALELPLDAVLTGDRLAR